jgi:tRNA-specific 2-thiouridylase
MMEPGSEKKKRVVVAMSGGVDSTVAAGLLKEQGYEVIGVTMKVFSLPKEICLSEELRACCGWQAIEDARQAAFDLGVAHFVVDFRKEFESSVIADFCREYSRGRTPNPCVRCNEHIKFGLLAERSTRLGAELFATGHHARVAFHRPSGRYRLLRAADRSKDQSYFLYPLTQEQLSRSLFPVGGMLKREVRVLARKWGLRVADKPESQEICFAPLGDYPDFLRKRGNRAFAPGPIKDAAGRVLGEHQGIGRFTVGQRRGLGIAGAKPLYVVAIDGPGNTVYVGRDEDLLSKTLTASGVNWVSIEPPDRPIRAKARIRSRHEAAGALVTPLKKGRVRVDFDRAQRAVAPGQSVVFYARGAVLGGGIID